MRANRTAMALLLWTCWLPMALGQATDGATDPAASSAPSIFDRAKSFLSGPKSGTEDADAAGNAEKRGERRRDDADAEGKDKSFLGSVKGVFGFGSDEKMVTKVKDITEVSGISAKQFDPACTTIVEPFGLTDNAASLALLAAKVAITNLGGGAQQNVKATVRMAGKNLNWLPMKAERLLGEHQHEEMAGELLDPSRKSDKEVVARANEMMQKLLQQIKEDTPYHFDLSVQRKGGGNAQALPGGFILIEKDLAADKKKEGIAYFALAHEIAHVLQRHETRSIQARLTDSLDSMDGLKKLIDSANSNPAALMGFSNEIMSRFVVFSQAQELQADACAVRLLDSAFTDRKRLADVIRSFTKSLPPPAPAATTQGQLDMFIENVGKMSKLQDQHPNSQERSHNLEKMLVEVTTPAQKNQNASAVVVTPR